MKIAKLAEYSVDELRRERLTLEEQIFRIRFQLQTGNAMNPARIRETRRELARVRTILRERELGIERTRRAPDSGAGTEGQEKRR